MVRTRTALTDTQREKLVAVTAAREARLAAEREYRRAVADADSAHVTKSAIAKAAGVSVEAVRTVLIRMGDSHTPRHDHLTGVDAGTGLDVARGAEDAAAPVTTPVIEPVAKAS